MPASVDSFSADAAIVGGGPSGLAAAIALRLRGWSVNVYDARRPPIDKPCGEGFLPGASAALSKLGLDLGSLPGIPLRGIRFLGHHTSVYAPFPRSEGRGVRRTHLHEALVARAEDLGVRLKWNHPVSTLDSLRERWIIGADGIQSRVRQWAGLGCTEYDSVRFGFQRHLALEPWSNNVEVHWGAFGQAYVTPVGDREIGLAVLTHRPEIRLPEVLADLPALRSRLAAAPATADRGAVTARRRLRRVTRGNIALIGDASGSVDAITGEGLSLSFRQADLLATALAANNPQLYEAGHRKLARRPQFMGALMMLLDRSPRLRDATLSALAVAPPLFFALVRVHIGREPENPKCE